MNEDTKDMGEGETVMNGADEKTEGGKEEESLEQVEEITDGDRTSTSEYLNIHELRYSVTFCH